MNSFTTLDSIIAKYEFSKYRNLNKVYFSYKYEVHDACLKYTYILQRIKSFIENLEDSRNLRILEMGCGNGHLLRIISNEYNFKCFGFDPILKSPRVKLQKFQRDRFKRINYKLESKNHIDFMKNNKNKFDIVYDACSLTHFDTTRHEEINLGWAWALNYLPSIIKPDGLFICATDTSEINPDNEFFNSTVILNRFKKIGEINDLNSIESSIKPGVENHQLFSQYNEPFVRLASANNRALLNVLGFEVKFK